MFGRKRVKAPLFVSIQTRSAEAIGALGFAFFTPYQTPAPVLGTGILAGGYVMEAGRQMVVEQQGTLLGYGGLYAGTYAQQNLVASDYLRDTSP